jgi:hypothetical protein
MCTPQHPFRHLPRLLWQRRDVHDVWGTKGRGRRRRSWRHGACGHVCRDAECAVVAASGTNSTAAHHCYIPGTELILCVAHRSSPRCNDCGVALFTTKSGVPSLLQNFLRCAPSHLRPSPQLHCTQLLCRPCAAVSAHRPGQSPDRPSCSSRPPGAASKPSQTE